VVFAVPERPLSGKADVQEHPQNFHNIDQHGTSAFHPKPDIKLELLKRAANDPKRTFDKRLGGVSMRQAITLLMLVVISLPVMARDVRNPGAPVNTEYHEAFSAVIGDGLTMYISSDRPGGHGAAEKGIFFGDASYDIYVTHRESLDSPWGPVVNLGPNINTSASEHSPMLSPDGHYLYFMSSRSSGYGSGDIYRSYREVVTDDKAWGEAENLGGGVNGPYVDSCPVFFVSKDGSAHLFYVQASGPDLNLLDFKTSELDQKSNSFMASRTVEISTPGFDAHLDPWHGLIWGVQYPGGLGGSDIWRTQRIEGENDLTKSWTTPINLGPEINTQYDEQMPSATANGGRLFFNSDRPGGNGGMDIYEAVNDAAN
jgi:hypothetical protein